MSTTQKQLPKAAFHSCCGLRIQLGHKANCPAAAPAITVAPAPANDDGELVFKRVGARITWTRGSKSGVLKFRIVSAARQAEQAIRANPGKLEEAIAIQQAGLWS